VPRRARHLSSPAANVVLNELLPVRPSCLGYGL
jgi:hypothetical protein